MVPLDAKTLILFYGAHCTQQSCWYYQETFESIVSQAKQNFQILTKKIEKILIETSNLLIRDYVEKFINQTVAGTINVKAVELTRSQAMKSDTKCGTMITDVEKCIPYINYLDNKKHYQLDGLNKTFQVITNYFERALKKCDSGVEDTPRCKHLVVSFTYFVFIYTSRIKIKSSQNSLMKIRLQLLMNRLQLYTEDFFHRHAQLETLVSMTCMNQLQHYLRSLKN